MSEYHISVLLQEAVDALQIQKGKRYIDATLGAGGHTREILARGGIVLGIDQDADAIAQVSSHFRSALAEKKLIIAKSNFSHIGDIAKQHEFTNVAGVLFDLGVSGHQLDTGERGFSFLSDAPLDMRMDKELAVTASDLLKVLTKKELYELFRDYGEETYAWKLAQVIDSARRVTPITTTKQLADLVARSVPKKGNVHPATKIFQALRIAVNDELGAIEEGLQQAVSLVAGGGRVVIISFHSLEDRIVKKAFAALAEKGVGKVMTEKPIVPTEEEIQANKRSRSAKMRIFEKL